MIIDKYLDKDSVNIFTESSTPKRLTLKDFIKRDITEKEAIESATSKWGRYRADIVLGNQKNPQIISFFKDKEVGMIYFDDNGYLYCENNKKWYEYREPYTIFLKPVLYKTWVNDIKKRYK